LQGNSYRDFDFLVHEKINNVPNRTEWFWHRQTTAATYNFCSIIITQKQQVCAAARCKPYACPEKQ
jgi:hypothetical protein